MFVSRLFRYSILSIVFFISACAATSDDQIESTSAINDEQSSTPDQNETISGDVADTQSPDIPENLHLYAPSQSSAIYLAWDVATDNVGVEGYRVYRNGILFNSTTSNTFVDSTVNENSIYQYFIEAYDAANNTARSGILSVVTPVAPDETAPSVPSGLVANQVSSDQVSLSWNTSTDNVSVVGYRVFRNGSLLTSTSVTSYIDLTVNEDMAYQYQVEAYDAVNNTARSNILNVITPVAPDVTAPTVPSNLNADAVTSDEVSLSWDVSIDNIGVAGYRVFRNGSLLTTTTVNAYNDLSVNDDTDYQYQVEVFDAENNTARSSVLNVTTPVAPDVMAPSAPGGLNATEVTASQVSFSWSASTDNIAVTYYRIYKDQSNEPYATTASLSFTDSGLAENQTYVYSVAAVDAAGNESLLSSELSVTTLVAVVAQPVDLRWVAPTQNTDDSCIGSIQGYQLHYGTSSGNYTATLTVDMSSGDISCEQTDFDNACNVAVMTCTYTIQSLDPGTWYFAMQAIDASGVESTHSNEVSKLVN